MKTYSLILILLISGMIYGLTREVSLDGTLQYSSIQTAIDASVNGDIVQVHPGEYFEHLNTNGKSITIQSMYPTTQSEETINNTIIHADVLNSCLEVKLQESISINGFTMMNNYPTNLGVNLNGIGVYGGGIEIYNQASIQILNCIIKNSLGRASGGVYFCGLNFYMSNTKIFDNYGIDYSGGISIDGQDSNSIVFDSVHPNSIYNNTGRIMDVFIRYWSTSINIVFHTFSILLTQPDFFYFSGATTGVTISVQNAYLNLVNHDLYVSPTGNNANSGLTPSSPLQTVAYAAKIIESDSLYPKTIHLASGTYNFSESNQFYPFSLKSHIRLVGEDMDSTVLDSEQSLRGYVSVGFQNDIQIMNITFTPFDLQASSIGMGNCDNIVLKNLRIDGNCEEIRINLSEVSNAICENIIVSNSSVADNNEAFYLSHSNNIILNNIIINNLDILGEMANSIGYNINESDVVIRNSIISNCEGYDVTVLFYQNIEQAQVDNTLDLSNLLIYNNQSTGSNMWSGAPVYLSNRFQRMKINNCTIANNNGTNNRVAFIKGDCDITNSIFDNPGNLIEIYLNNQYDVYSHHPTINYSLLKQPISASNWSQLTTNNIMQNIDPLFQGSLVDTLSWTLPEYYKLSAGSPCINAGTPDTLGLNISPMDLEGNYRVWNNRIDMGCYEYGSEHYVANDNPEYPTLPDRIILSTYPNPVYLNSAKGAYCFIEFTLPEKAKERPVVEIYNLKGQKVRTIKDNYELQKLRIENGEWRIPKDELVRRKGSVNSNDRDGRLTDKQDAYATKAGATSYSTVFDCRDEHSQRLASGVYIVKVTSGIHQKAMKMTILK